VRSKRVQRPAHLPLPLRDTEVARHTKDWEPYPSRKDTRTLYYFQPNDHQRNEAERTKSHHLILIE
jgi:hypothetical protein